MLQKFDEHIEHEQEGQHFERIEKGIQNDVEQSAGLREFLGSMTAPVTRESISLLRRFVNFFAHGAGNWEAGEECAGTIGTAK